MASNWRASALESPAAGAPASLKAGCWRSARPRKPGKGYWRCEHQGASGSFSHLPTIAFHFILITPLCAMRYVAENKTVIINRIAWVNFCLGIEFYLNCFQKFT
jgi:hypothetical protein